MAGPGVTVAGLDGWAGGWVGVELSNGRWSRALVAAQFSDALDQMPAAEVIGVDIPIGLAENTRREADIAAKRLLGSRSSTVFITPPRAALEAPTYAAARDIAIKLTGASVSAQAFALRAKILEVEAVAHGDSRIYEVHPELAFRRLNRDRPVPSPKKTWAGVTHRRRLLAAAGVALPDDAGPAGRVPPDDLLDAAVVAHTAALIARGIAARVPAAPAERIGGIWY